MVAHALTNSQLPGWVDFEQMLVFTSLGSEHFLFYPTCRAVSRLKPKFSPIMLRGTRPSKDFTTHSSKAIKLQSFTKALSPLQFSYQQRGNQTSTGIGYEIPTGVDIAADVGVWDQKYRDEFNDFIERTKAHARHRRKR